ncbi:hypothetical protein ABT317_50855, partial [Streptomyces carpinensis]
MVAPFRRSAGTDGDDHARRIIAEGNGARQGVSGAPLSGLRSPRAGHRTAAGAVHRLLRGVAGWAAGAPCS